jgi:dTDP-glucose 4,6-dehydratase
VQQLSDLKDSTILVTGGTGFMGTWIAETIAYLNDYYDFNAKLVLLSSSAKNFKIRYPALAARQGIALIERDIRNLNDIQDDINWIIHAAASPDNRNHLSDPKRTIEVIVNGTNSALEFASRLPDLRRFLNISSGHVYGTQPWDMEKIPESYFGSLDCSSLTSVYPESKRLAETLCTVFKNQQRIPIANARPFAFIGPYQSLDSPWAINNFIRDGIHGGPIRILGDGLTVRSYMYPSDMALWLLTILVKGSNGVSYNVGSPNGITLQNLAEKIANRFATPPKIIARTSKDKNLHSTRFVPDISLAQNKLGLKIKVDLDTAITRTLQWNRDFLI